MIETARVRLRRKHMSDAPDDFKWGSDVELARLDAALPLKTSYARYRAEYAGELVYPSFGSRRFAIETLAGKHIGNCSYYNIDPPREEAEIGIMIGEREYWDQGYGTEAVTLLIDLVFRRTEIKRLYLKTLTSNARAQRCFEKCGLIPYDSITRGRHEFILMECHRDSWQAKTGRKEKNGERALQTG